MSLALAAIALIGSVLALRFAWGRRNGRSLWLTLASLLFGASIVLTAADVGNERAVALVLIVVAVPAYAAVVANVNWMPRRERVERNGARVPSVSHGVTLRWLSAALGGAIAAMALATAVAIWLPGAPALRTILAVLAIPLLWAIFAGWCLATRRPRRVLVWIVFCSLGSAGAIVLPMLT